MRKPAYKEPSPPAAASGAVEDLVSEAARRLEFALQRLETSTTVSRPAGGADAAEHLVQAHLAERSRAWEEEKAALAEQLRRAREREQALQQVATLASAAIGRATAEVRAALGDDELGNDAPGEGAEDEPAAEAMTDDDEEAA